MYLLYQCIHWYKFKNEGVERSLSFKRIHLVFQPQYVSINRLYSYVHKNQLTEVFGGQLEYKYSDWLQNRLVGEHLVQ